jgi:hypothetical protein
MSEVINITQNKVLEPEVKILLGGKERTMRLDFNALALIEERTGRSIMSMADWKSMNSRDIRSLVWASLVHEDESLTESQIGKWLSLQMLPIVMKAFSEAMHISMKGELPPATPVEETGGISSSPLAETPSLPN